MLEPVQELLACKEQLKQEIPPQKQYLGELGVLRDEVFRGHWASASGPDLKPAPAANYYQLSEPAAASEVLGDMEQAEVAVSAEPNTPSSVPNLPYQQR